jgi:hypothetical protein
MTDEAYLQRRWFGGRDTGHLTFTEAVELTMQKRYEWKGLTDEEAMQICIDCGCMSEEWLVLLDAIEAKLQEKNV